MLGPDEELQERGWSPKPPPGARGSWQEQGHTARSRPVVPGERLGRQARGCRMLLRAAGPAVGGARARARGVPEQCQLRWEKSSILWRVEG